MREWIAEKRIAAIRASGERVHVVARIGRPYEVAAGEWACPASLNDLHNNLVDIRGVSSMQALRLAVNLLRRLLNYFVDDGGRLLVEDLDEDFNIETCFSDSEWDPEVVLAPDDLKIVHTNCGGGKGTLEIVHLPSGENVGGYLGEVPVVQFKAKLMQKLLKKLLSEED